MFARRTTRDILLSVTMSAAVVALAFSPASVPAAQEGKHEAQAKMPTSMAQLMKMDPDACMKMMDKGHKGHVTKKEFMKFQEELWRQMDKNRDGRVDKVEYSDQG